MQTNHFCENCAELHPTKLIKNSNNETFGCPRCHCKYSFESGNMVRVAQFGGQLPRPNNFGPGSSPVFNGTSTKNRGVNMRFESSIDSVISRTHNPAPIDPERNLEKRLEQFHNYAEENAINYELTPKERKRLKLRKEIRRREKFYEDAAKRVDQNSVHYIKENFNTPEEHMMTREEALSSRRKYEDTKPGPLSEDVSPEQQKAERKHTVAKVKHGLTSVFMDPASETDPNLNPGMLNMWPSVGNYGGSFKTNKELETYLYDNEIPRDTGDFTNNNTDAFTFPLPEEDYGSFFMPKNYHSSIKNYFDPQNMTLEDGLEALMKSKSPDRLPHLDVQVVNIDTYKLQGKEPGGVAEKYPSSPAGFLGITPMPKNRLK
jgi:hypothetical protein